MTTDTAANTDRAFWYRTRGTRDLSTWSLYGIGATGPFQEVATEGYGYTVTVRARSMRRAGKYALAGTAAAGVGPGVVSVAPP